MMRELCICVCAIDMFALFFKLSVAHKGEKVDAKEVNCVK